MKNDFMRKNGKAFLALSLVSLIGMHSTQAMQPVVPTFTMTCPAGSALKHHASSIPGKVIFEGETTEGHLFESEEPVDEAIFVPLIHGAVPASGRAPDGVRLICKYVNPQDVHHALYLFLNDRNLSRECRVTPNSADFECKKGGGY